jgi:hypothetical protein
MRRIKETPEQKTERRFLGINFDGAAENSNNKLTSLLAFTVKTLRVAGLPELLA